MISHQEKTGVRLTGRNGFLHLVLIVFLGLAVCFSFLKTPAYAASKPGKVKKITTVFAAPRVVRLKWTKASRAVGYQIYAKRGNGKYKKQADLKSKSKTVQKRLTGLKPGSAYKFKVRGYKVVKGKKVYGAFSALAVKTPKESISSGKGTMKVSATNAKINISLSGIGSKGTAKVVVLDIDKYLESERMLGYQANLVTKGTTIGTYKCKKKAKISINRYTKKDHDRLYDKYYVVQGSKILKGPIYVTDVQAKTNKPIGFEAASKKGMLYQNQDAIDTIKDTGCSWAVEEINLSYFLLPNEDANGKKINWEGNPDAIKFVSNGKNYYFSKYGLAPVDREISAASRNGINVIGLVIAQNPKWPDFDGWNWNKFPNALTYTPLIRFNAAINTSTPKGRDYWIAAMEFISNRYSQSKKNGLISTYVIGNEIDYAYDWNNLSTKAVYDRKEFNPYMEEYCRCLRLANLAVKQQSSALTVNMPLTKCWAKPNYKIVKYKSKTNNHYNTYAPKDMCEWVNKYSKAEGDFDWGIAPHPYPVVDLDADVNYKDSTTNTIPWSYSGKIVTGDPNTSEMITPSNVELYQLFMDQKHMKYKGKTRSVWLTESGVGSGQNSSEEMNEHAATVAQYYYRCASLPCVKAVCYYPVTDTNRNTGLITKDNQKKPAYNVWKYIDTSKSFDYANKYLKYIKFHKIAKDGTQGKLYSVENGKIRSYKSVMKITDSDFDWNKYWKPEEVTPIKFVADEEPSTADSLTTDKKSYDVQDPILVTAGGKTSDIVGIFKKTDKPQTADPIYWYSIGKENEGRSHELNKTYDLKAYGVLSASRFQDAPIGPGEYQICLMDEDRAEVLKRADITITGTGLNLSEPYLSSNKDTYKKGEDIIVTAAGGPADENKTWWVGLYRKNDVPGSGITSIYWYYLNHKAGESDDGMLNSNIRGKSTVLQAELYNSSSAWSRKLAPGEYVLYLFGDKGTYVPILKKAITIEDGASEASVRPKNLKSITYKLDNNTDGFANGTVTVDAGSSKASDCIMYWADAEGKPLEGYTNLAKFKLSGSAITKHDMTDHTIIPQGAVKLIAYASQDGTRSEDYVSCDLPEGCQYSIDPKDASGVESEFELISDVHITTDQGAVREMTKDNEHFKQMLQDVKDYSPNSQGIFINGDMADTGSEMEFKRMLNYWEEAGGAPKIHMSIGNHDWAKNNPNKQFQRYVNLFNPDVKTDTVYYTEKVNGYPYIYLGGEQANLHAIMSETQLEWFDKTMEKYTKEDPNKPVFVFLHQPMYNTCAGSLPGQNWDGVENEAALRKILKKYGQIVLFSGHSHWHLDSDSCMDPGDDDTPIVLNTAAGGYLWDSYNKITGEYMEGSQGYMVRVYKDKIIFLGREFTSHEFKPSAIFVVQRPTIKTGAVKYVKTAESAIFSLKAAASNGAGLSYSSSDTDVLTVSKDGYVNTREKGTAVITITARATGTSCATRKSVVVEVK